MKDKELEEDFLPSEDEEDDQFLNELDLDD